MIHIHNGILLSHKKRLESFVDRWMGLETVRVKKEKGIYCILMYVSGIFKNGTNEPTAGQE